MAGGNLFFARFFCNNFLRINKNSFTFAINNLDYDVQRKRKYTTGFVISDKCLRYDEFRYREERTYDYNAKR